MSLLIRRARQLGVPYWRQTVRYSRFALLPFSVGLLVLLLRASGALQALELAALDRLFQIRPAAPSEERAVVVEITESDVQAAGQWPLSDRTIAALIERILAAEPRVVGLDIYRDLDSPPGTERLRALMTAADNLIGIQQLQGSEEISVRPPPILAERGQVGFNNVVLDVDGKVRRNVLYWHVDGELHTSFSLKLALLYLRAENIQPQGAANNPEHLQLGSTTFRPFQSHTGGYVRKDAKGYQVLANFRPPEHLASVKMSDLMAGRVPPERLRDRVVIIGSTAASLKDFAYIPYNDGLFGPRTPIYGVKLHANFVSQIISAALDGRAATLRTLPRAGEWLWILAWSLPGAIVVARQRSWLRSALWLLCLILGLGGLAHAAFAFSWWLPAVPSLITLTGSWLLLTSRLAYQREELRRSMEFLHSVFDTIPDPIFVCDRAHHWLVVNQAFCQFSGFSEPHLLGKTACDIFPLAEAEAFWQAGDTVFATGTASECEEQLTDADGNQYAIATKRSLHRDAAGNFFLVGVIRDITERKRIEDNLRRTAVELSRSNAQLQDAQHRLHHLAYYDSLTGLPNRKYFQESLEQFLAWASREENYIGLLYLDLNGFKAVNDTLGHHIGDLLLKAVAGRLKNCLRGSDVVARLGGDEFTVILPDIKQGEDVEIVITKIRATLAQTFMLEGQSVSIAASIGTSVYPIDGKHPKTLLEQADRAMYAAKHGKHGKRNKHSLRQV